MREKILMIYGVSLLLGILTGAVGSYFQLAIHYVNRHLLTFYAYVSHNHLWAGLVSALVSMLMVFMAWLAVRYVAPEASGSGVQEIEGTLLHIRPITWRRLLPVKFFGGVLTIAANMVSGREGPTIQMGANLGDMLGDLLKIKRRRRDTLIAAGAAAGLATAFNAPLAGVLFVIEEMRNAFNFSFTNFKMVAISCVMATITSYFIIGSGPAIPMAMNQEPGMSSLVFFFFFGIVMGLAGLLFNRLMMIFLAFTDRLSMKARIIYVLIIGASVGFLTIYSPLIVGGGYDIIEQFLSLPPGIIELMIVLLVRFILTILCYSTGVPGGIFAPMLALGTLMGMTCYYFVNLIAPDLGISSAMFAVAGMGALFSASIRSPLTGIVLVVEMTQNYLLILPMMVSCLTSTTITQLANNLPIYSQLLRRTLKLAQKSPT